MNYEFAAFMMVVVQNYYPGGLRQFEADGGQYGLAPGNPCEMVVYHPNPSVEFKNVITHAAEVLKVRPRFVTTLNFQGREPDEIMEILQTHGTEIIQELHLENSIQVVIGRLLNILILTDPRSTIATAEELVAKLREILPACIRTYVAYGDKRTALFEYPLTEEPASKVQVVLEVPARQTVIGDDDLLNLKIALETQSVDDFINSI